MDLGMRRAIERFPELEASIRARFHDDPSFRDMCEDYAETLEVLQQWRASDSPQRVARIDEYRELAEGLELEIATALRCPLAGKTHDL